MPQEFLSKHLQEGNVTSDARAEIARLRNAPRVPQVSELVHHPWQIGEAKLRWQHMPQSF
jgi:hypothetical protein